MIRRLTVRHVLFLFGFLAGVSTGVPLFGAPGDLVSIEFERSYSADQITAFITPLYTGFERPEMRLTVDVYQAVYESRYPDGAPARVWAQVLLPRYPDGETAVRAVYAFGPGSTGLIDNCRPSREHEAGIRWGLYRAHVLSHAGNGVIGIIPDYLGFRDPERDQYYMVAEAEAAALLDGIRALSQIIETLDYRGVRDTRNFVAGFSQGGHAAFAAADYNRSYAPDIDLCGVIGYGPTTDIPTLLLEYPSVAPMLLYTYSRLYGIEQADPALALRPEYAEYLEDDVLSQCVGAMQSYYPHAAKNLYRPEFHKALIDRALEERYPGLARVFSLNSSGLRAYGADILILQGTDDIVVFPESQQAFVERLRSLGIPVDLRVFEGYRHDTRQIAYPAVQRWMNERLVPATSPRGR